MVQTCRLVLSFPFISVYIRSYINTLEREAISRYKKVTYLCAGGLPIRSVGWRTAHQICGLEDCPSDLWAGGLPIRSVGWRTAHHICGLEDCPSDLWAGGLPIRSVGWRTAHQICGLEDCPYSLPGNSWQIKLQEWPPLEFRNIYAYLIS